MNDSRTKKSIKNIVFTLGSYFAVLLMQMINRTVFVKFLPVDYLGINGLFSNILSLLSLTELGIGTAITYSLYKPLRKNDENEILGIMQLYKFLYCVIGIIVFAIGLVLLPFLGWFIESIPDFTTWNLIRLYYMVYVVNTSVSYFATYKRTLLICDQKQYITSVISAICKMLLNVGQIFLIVLTKNYLLYIVAMIFSTLIENILLTYIANREYPYLRKKEKYRVSEDKVREIKKNVYAMIFHRIGDVVINASDNIIITKFASLLYTGLYSNYLVVISAVRTVLNQVFSAVTASVGNLIAGNSKEKDYDVFKKMLFINFILYSYCSLGLTILLNDFVKIWLGKDYLLDEITITVICYSFFLTGMLKTVRVFRDAAGIFYYDRYKPIAESILNILFSVPLTIKYQIAGALMGTILSCLLVSFWVEAFVLFKYHFSFSVKKYYIEQFKYWLMYSFILAIGEITTHYISIVGMIGLIIKGIIITLEFVIIIFLFFYKSTECNYLLQLFRNVRRKNAKR